MAKQERECRESKPGTSYSTFLAGRKFLMNAERGDFFFLRNKALTALRPAFWPLSIAECNGSHENDQIEAVSYLELDYE